MELARDYLSEILPHCKSKDPFCFGPGSGWVSNSFFTAYDNEVRWIVYLSELETYAYLKVGPAWIETYASLILNSPHIYVSWTEKHKIIYWAVAQEKTDLPGELAETLLNQERNEINKP